MAPILAGLRCGALQVGLLLACCDIGSHFDLPDRIAELADKGRAISQFLRCHAGPERKTALQCLKWLPAELAKASTVVRVKAELRLLTVPSVDTAPARG
jgi:hypothetical protein